MEKDGSHSWRTRARKSCGFVQGCAGSQTCEGKGALTQGKLPGGCGEPSAWAGASYQTQSWECCFQALGCPLICQVGWREARKLEVLGAMAPKCLAQLWLQALAPCQVLVGSQRALLPSSPPGELHWSGGMPATGSCGNWKACCQRAESWKGELPVNLARLLGGVSQQWRSCRNPGGLCSDCWRTQPSPGTV